MITKYVPILTLLSFTACATPLESVRIPIPAAGLKVGHQADVRGRGTIREFVPRDEEIASWRHLVTIQFLEGETRTPDAFVGGLEQGARAHGGKLEWAVLDRDAHSVIYEWSLLDCPKEGAVYQDQCEIARVLRGKDGLHRIAYTERARKMDAAARDKYLNAFREAHVVKGDKLVEIESAKAP